MLDSLLLTRDPLRIRQSAVAIRLHMGQLAAWLSCVQVPTFSDKFATFSHAVFFL
jgi:hypothetical protein